MFATFLEPAANKMLTTYYGSASTVCTNMSTWNANGEREKCHEKFRRIISHSTCILQMRLLLIIFKYEHYCALLLPSFDHRCLW